MSGLSLFLELSTNNRNGPQLGKTATKSVKYYH